MLEAAIGTEDAAAEALAESGRRIGPMTITMIRRRVLGLRWGHRPALYRLGGATVAGVLLVGCAGDSQPRPLAGVERAERRIDASAPPPSVAERAPVVLNGSPIPWSELHPYLAEAGGRAALEEAMLDRLIDRELESQGLRVTQADADAEYAELVTLLRTRVGDGGEDSETLVVDMRRAMGLGPHRFKATLMRNAKLRALVRDRVEVSEDDLRLAYEIDYGPRTRVRLITTPTQRDAAAVSRSLAGLGGESLRLGFAQAAMDHSTDPSGPAGGLIESLSPADPAYPAGLTQAISGLSVGQMTPVIALDNGYALAFVEATIPATGTSMAAVRERLEREVRARRERLAMERLALQLLERASVTVFDPSLEWAREAGR